MGHPYRERHQVASTTTDNLAGLTGQQGIWSDDNTLEELRNAAKDAGLPTSGNKLDLIERLNNPDS